MQRNDDILEEDRVLVPEWNSETTDDTCQNIKKLSCTIELMILVDEGEKALIDCLSDHFSSWYEFGIQFVENIF